MVRLVSGLAALTSVLALSSPSSLSNKNPAITVDRGDCAVIGVGVLGTSLCRQILEDPDSRGVTGVTRTTQHHDAIRAAVLPSDSSSPSRFRLVAAGDPRLKKFTNVVFCAPPSGFDDYAAAVKEAAENYWMGPDGGGVFVFTSIGAV